MKSKPTKIRANKKYYVNHKQDILKKQKLYYEKNKDKISNTLKRYYIKNTDNIIKKRKLYYKKNKKKVLDYHKDYYIKNISKIKEDYIKNGEIRREKRKDYHKEYKIKNSNTLKQYLKDYQRKNKEKIKNKSKQYYINNKDLIKKHQKEYYKKYIKVPGVKEKRKIYYEYNKKQIMHQILINHRKRYKEDMKYRIMYLTRNRIRVAFHYFLKKGIYLNSSKRDIDYKGIISHLIKTMPKDYAINKKNYEIDHIVPLFSFDLSNPFQFKIAFAPENHQWLFLDEHKKKNANEMRMKHALNHKGYCKHMEL